MNYLFNNLLHFGQVLHDLGLDVQAGRMSGVAAALEHIDIGRKSDFYFTLRTLLVHRHQDLETFDEAFRVFWRPPSAHRSRGDLRALGEQRRFGNPQVDFPSTEPRSSEDDSSVRTLSDVVERIAPLSYSAREVSRIKDFAEFTEHEINQAKAMLAAINWDLGMRWTHRWTAGEGSDIDARRLLRRNMKYAGELLELPKRRRKQKRRPLVLLCDISGSMERYSRMLLHFVHSVTGGLDRV